MKCNKCAKEISNANDIVYCPFCGGRLETKAGSEKSLLRRELKVSYWLRALIVWVLIVGILEVLDFALVVPQMEEIWVALFGVNSAGILNWLSLAFIMGIGTYFTLAYVVYSHAKEHRRRAVAWATAFIVFTPILGGLLYLLSWPKE